MRGREARGFGANVQRTIFNAQLRTELGVFLCRRSDTLVASTFSKLSGNESVTQALRLGPLNYA